MPKIGTIIARKHHETRRYDLLFVYLGSRGGYVYLLNRRAQVVDMSISFLETFFKTKECIILE